MNDLRDFIRECEKKLPREFVKVTKEVNPKFEISAIIKKLDLMGKHPLVFFEVVTKVGTDATAKPFRKDMPPVAKIPDEVMNRINLKDYISHPEDHV